MPLGCVLVCLTDAAEQWAPEFAGMSRPLTALLIGGPTSPFAFTAFDLERMIERVVELHANEAAQ